MAFVSRTCRTCSRTCSSPRPPRWRRGERAERLPAVGPSFRDATRVAGANSAIWTDIYLSNRDALIAAIDELAAAHARGSRDACGGDARGAAAWNERARVHRDALLGAGWPAVRCTSCASRCPTGPGVIAEIALALGRAGVNIVDMALSPSEDNSQGVVALWIGGERDARRAERADRRARLPGRGAVNMRFEPARGAVGRAARAGRQVDLSPRRAARRDGRRARAHRALPARGRHDLDARGGARAGGARRDARRGGRHSRHRPARGARARRRDRRRQRRHAAAPASRLAGGAGGTLRSRSTATSRSAGARPIGSQSRCA